MSAEVRDIRAIACEVPTQGPEADGTLRWDSTTIVFVEVDAGGQCGLGWTYAPASAVDVVSRLLAPVVRGEDALAPAALQSRMVRAVRNAGRPGLVGMALSAVDIALWDVCARVHGLPLHRLWGGPVSEVRVYGSGGFTTYDDARLGRQLESWCALGLDHVKIKIGESWGTHVDRDLDRVALTRRVVGPENAVMVDANGGYDRAQAVRVGQRLDDLGVVWFEEPVSSDDLDGLAHVRQRVRADVAAGEYGHDAEYFARMAAAGSVDCLQVDVTRCGGYTEWLRSVAVAGALHLEVSGHCAPYATAPVAAATPNVRHLEWFHDHVRIEQMFLEGAEDPVGAVLSPAEDAGHGLTLRPGLVSAHRVA